MGITPLFLTVALDGDEWTASFPEETASSNHRIGDCVGAPDLVLTLRKRDKSLSMIGMKS